MATLTITTTAAQDARIAAAFGSQLNLGRDATGAEVRAAIIAYVRNTVLAYEQTQAVRTATQTAIAGVVPVDIP